MAKKSVKKSEKEKAKRIFLVVLITWLVSLPAIMIVQIIFRFILARTGAEASGLVVVVNVISLLVGVYGILGWIPTLVLGIIWQEKK